MEGEVRKRTTLFVRNIPYSSTDNDLEELFSDYGPIKHCFVVRNRGKINACRGFGYVTFVTQGDANKATEAEIKMGNRKVLVCFADKKPKKEKSKRKKEDDAKESGDEDEGNVVQTRGNMPPKKVDDVKTMSEIEDKDEQQRTVVITGLTKKVKRKQLKSICADYGEIEKFVFPVKERSEVTALVTYNSIKSSVRAFQKLCGQTIKDSVIYACLLSKEGKLPSRKILDKAKLIVRNLSFKCTSDELKNTFQKFGPVIDINIPTKDHKKSKNMKAGFGFVQFKRIIDAQNALQKLNQKEILGRPMVIDWAIPKESYQAEKDGTEKISEDIVYNKGDRNLSVLGELSNTTTNSEGNIEDKNVDNQASERNDSDSGDDNKESIYEDTDKIVDEDGKQSDFNDSEEDHDDFYFIDKKGKTSSKSKKQFKDVKEGKTIFIRNLSFETSEEQLKEEFSQFGKVQYCKIVTDKETGHSRGTAFVKFTSTNEADLCLAKVGEEGYRKGIALDGRQLYVSKAVTRGKAEELLKEKKKEKKDPKDKRNLYLANEGAILPGSEAAEGLSEHEMKKREKAMAEKKMKLKNQNYFISKTRLCARNLPLNVDDSQLQSVFLKFLSKPGARILKARVMRNKDRVDKTGRNRSLGFGFIEFETHEDALATLRATNNNPEVFGEQRRPIVEFAVENQLALNLQMKRREIRHQQQQRDNKTNPEEEKHDGNDASNQRRSRHDKKRFPDRKEKRRKRNRSETGEESGTNDNMIRSGLPGSSQKKVTEKRQGKSAAKKSKSEKSDNVDNQHKSNKRKNSGKDALKSVRKRKDRIKGPLFKPDNDTRKKHQSQDSDRNSFGNDTKKNRKRSHRDIKKQVRSSDDFEVKKRRKLEDERNKMEEKKFSNMVEQYKTKLFGKSADETKMTRTRWFE